MNIKATIVINGNKAEVTILGFVSSSLDGISAVCCTPRGTLFDVALDNLTIILPIKDKE